MGVFKHTTPTVPPPPAYEQATGQSAPGASQSAAGMNGVSSQSNQTLPMSQINQANGYNPPVKPGMSGYQYAEIAPPPETDMHQVQKFQGNPPPPFAPSGVGLAASQPVMHYYRNPMGHVIQSPLPPSHPAMQCLISGQHVVTKRYGILGVIMGILFCPLGCIWTVLDFQERCDRCGEIVGEGCYSC